MRSPPSMSREQDGPVPLTPYSITVEDDRSAAAYTTADTIDGDFHIHDAKQPSTEFPLYYYPVSLASSPEARMSMSGSSAGSYSIPRGGRNWDSAVSSSSNPAERTAPLPVTALDSTHVEAPRAEAGLITESYTKGHPGLRWSADVSVSDGRNSRSVHDTPNTVTVYTTEDKEGGRSQEPNAVLVLLLFSAPIPLFSFCTSFYTLFSLLLVILTTPLRLCPPTSFFRSTTFSTQLCKLLAPALRNHERLAQSSSSDNYRGHHTTSSIYSPTDHFSAGGLILVLMVAPILSMGLLLAVWIAAFFWIFAMILGNPDGTEKKDDGRAAVLGVNGWWQTWLHKSRITPPIS